MYRQQEKLKSPCRPPRLCWDGWWTRPAVRSHPAANLPLSQLILKNFQKVGPPHFDQAEGWRW